MQLKSSPEAGFGENTELLLKILLADVITCNQKLQGKRTFPVF